MKKSIAALALAGSISLIGAGIATAATPAPYPAPSTGTTVSTSTVAPGGTVEFTVADGFQPGETVTITTTRNAAPQAAGAIGNGGASRSVAGLITLPQTVTNTQTVQANAKGGFSTPVKLGAQEGTYTITAVGNTSGHSVSQTVTVDKSLAAQPAGAEAGANAAAEANANAGSGLANTGADSGLVLWTLVGAGALAVGATSVVVVRRRAKNETAA